MYSSSPVRLGSGVGVAVGVGVDVGVAVGVGVSVSVAVGSFSGWFDWSVQPAIPDVVSAADMVPRNFRLLDLLLESKAGLNTEGYV